MNLKLIRRYFSEEYTIGSLLIDGVKFCDTLEDKTRDTNKDGDLNDPGEGKVAAQTAIPFGTYQVVLNVSPRFKRELPRLLNVPDFDGVLIHRGNTATDTAGCILIGENKVKGKVIKSTPYEIELVKRLKEAIKKGEEIKIEIV